jgi:hypothetical protein
MSADWRTAGVSVPVVQHVNQPARSRVPLACQRTSGIRTAGIEPASTSSQGLRPANGPRPVKLGTRSAERGTENTRGRFAFGSALRAPRSALHPVGKTGVEPAISRFRRARLLHLAHFPIARTERPAGFEPARLGWEPSRLPLTSRTHIPARNAERGARNRRPHTTRPFRVPHSAFRVSSSSGGRSRTGSSAFSARRFTMLASPESQPPPVPRRGIEPRVCRLKAGGFTIEACRAFPTRKAERGTRNRKPWRVRSAVPHSALPLPRSNSSGGWNRTSASRLQRAVSVPARNPPDHL